MLSPFAYEQQTALSTSSVDELASWATHGSSTIYPLQSRTAANFALSQASPNEARLVPGKVAWLFVLIGEDMALLARFFLLLFSFFNQLSLDNDQLE